MKKTGLILASLLLLVAVAHAASSVEWKVDPAHSTIGFSVDHLAITEVDGKFTSYEATVKADPETGKLTHVKGVVDVKSVDTGIGKRDEHLRSPDFFDVEKYPKMTLEVEKINYDGKSFSGKMKLSIKDVTKEVPFTGEYNGPQKVNFGNGPELRVGYKLNATIDRKEFNLNFSKIMEGVAVVGDEVRIRLNVQIAHPIEKGKK